MILQCPRCAARYRFDTSRLPGSAKRLTCRKCGGAIPVEDPESVPESVPRAQIRHAPFQTPVRIAPPLPRGSPAKTALLADEPREFRDLVSAVLREAGYEPTVVDNGEEALLLAGSHPFDLVLLNVYLRKALGITVCERIKATPELKATPIILAGNSLRRERAAEATARRYSADGFLETTAGRDAILQEINRVTGRRDSAGKIPKSPKTASAPVPPEPPVVLAESAGTATGSDEDSEIRRLARIIVSDIQIYHPEKFSRALRDGTFFEAFSDELGKGREMIEHRFQNVSNRTQILSAGLRDTLEGYRNGPARR